jgi:tRNA U34 2-thiouridine synthase MnmA/TrmU
MVKEKVVVAMSGGVDSSVAAALLKQQGYDVTGMMLRLWSEPGKEESNRCCTPDAMAQARRVAGILDIPFMWSMRRMFSRKRWCSIFWMDTRAAKRPIRV